MIKEYFRSVFTLLISFGADELSSDSHDRRRKTELTSRLSRNLIRRRKIYSLFLDFRSIGAVFSLTTEGHIDVSRFFHSATRQ
jgi:hypothetical protein